MDIAEIALDLKDPQQRGKTLNTYTREYFLWWLI